MCEFAPDFLDFILKIQGFCGEIKEDDPTVKDIKEVLEVSKHDDFCIKNEDCFNLI